LGSNRTVGELVQEVLRHWPGQWTDQPDPEAPHEAGKLNLSTDKAFHLLGWQPVWGFAQTVAQTVHWYRETQVGRADPVVLTREQIAAYVAEARGLGRSWAG
jgi:CDP-glucose 4,6-dehydratase